MSAAEQDSSVVAFENNLRLELDARATARDVELEATTTKNPATQRRYQDVVNAIADVENRMHQLRIVTGQVFGTKAWTSIEPDTRLGLGHFLRAELQVARQRLETARKDLLQQVDALDALLVVDDGAGSA